MTGRQSPLWQLASLSGVLLFLDWAWFVRPAATHIVAAPQDFMQFADLIHRIASGQTPHIDFHTPIGWLATVLPYAGFQMQGGFAGALEAADMLMLAALLPLACAVLAGRVPTWASAGVLVALFGLVAAPWRMGESGWESDPGLHYNHWGWAILTLTMLLGIRDGSRQWVMAAVVGGLLSLALFTKVTHFLACLGFVILFGAVLGEFRRAALYGMGLCAAVALRVHMVGGWMDDYALDVARTVRIAVSNDAAAQDGYIPRPALWTAMLAYSDAAIVLGLGAFALLSGALRRNTALHCLYALAACVAVLTQDAAHPAHMPAVLACIVRIASETSGATRKTTALAMLLHLAPILPKQALSGAVFSMAASGCCPDLAAGLPRMEGISFGGAGVTHNAITQGRPHWRDDIDAISWGRRRHYSSIDLSHAELRHTLTSGLRLLKDSGAAGGRVMTLDFGNPFPALLNAPPPKGVLFSMYAGRQADGLTAQDPGLTLGDAEWLMIPAFPVHWDSANMLLTAQADRLAREWTPAAENEHWRLLRRKNATGKPNPPKTAGDLR